MKNYFLLALILIGIYFNVVAQDVAIFPQMGHRDSIASVAFSPDGRYILSSSYDGVIKLWNKETGREIRTFSGYTDGMVDLVKAIFSPSGNQILSYSMNRDIDDSYYSIIKLWDITTGNEIRNFTGGHSDIVMDIIFTPNGNQFLSCSRDGTIKLWDIYTGRIIRMFSGHQDTVMTIAFVSEEERPRDEQRPRLDEAGQPTAQPTIRYGRQIISGSTDGTIKIWDLNSGRELRTFSLRQDKIPKKFSPDGRLVILSPYDRREDDQSIIIWDIQRGREIRTFSEQTGFYSSVEFSPDGIQLITGSTTTDFNTVFDENGFFNNSIIFSDIFIKLWDIETGRILKTFAGHSYLFYPITFNSDGNQILSSSDDKIKLWDVATGNEIRTYSGNSNSVRSVAFSSDGKHLLSGSFDGIINKWDVEEGREIRNFNTNIIHNYYWLFSVAFSRDGRRVISGLSNGTIKLFDTNTGQELRTFSGHSEEVTSVAFNPDGTQIASCSKDGTIKIWDTETGREIRTFPDQYCYSSIVFTPNGKHIFNGRYIMDIETGNKNFTAEGNEDVIAINNDGSQILYTSLRESAVRDGRNIILIDMVSWTMRTFDGHSGTVLSVAFSPDGKQIVSGSLDRTIKLWDAETGNEIRTFSGHTSHVFSVSFSPDGRQILSCSADGTIRLWDVLTGREIAQFISFTDGEWLVITPDGYYNASPNGDRYLTVRVGNNVYGIDQYRNTFYNPQIVEARLQGKPDPARWQGTIQQAGVPPTVVIRNPVNGARLTTSQAELSVVIDSRQPIRNIQFLVNGRLISGEAVRGMRGIRGVELEGTGVKITGNQNRLDFTVNLQLDPGNNRIEVIANNPHEGRDSVEVFSQQAAASNTLPNLWILSIGVNRYDSPLLDNLRYAVNDAREIINIFKAQEGKIYGKVNSRLIADDEAILPTRDIITDNLSYLRQAAPNDVVLLFIAGHGLNDEVGNFYFMPSDASFTDNGAIRTSRAISHREIQGVLDVPGQKLVFIDACHSNNASSNRNIRTVDNNRLVRDLQIQSQSTVIFTSSRGNQPSHEMDNLRHGVFTHSILQGMRGAANPDENGVISMLSLSAYVSKRVTEITSNSQTPTISIPEGFSDFRVARTR